MTSITTIGKILGATGIVGGGGLVAIGAVNANAALNLEIAGTEDRARITNELTTLDEQGYSFDASQVGRRLEEHERAVDEWKVAGLSTAVAGTVALAGGIAGVASKGTLGAIGRGIGIGAGLVAGGAALYGLNRYLSLPERADRVGTALKDVGTQIREQGVAQPPAVVGGTTTAVETREPILRQYAVALEEDASRAELRPVETQAQYLREVDEQGLGAVLRNEMSKVTRTNIPLEGEVDWNAIAAKLDANGDQVLDYDERTNSYRAMTMSMLAAMPADEIDDALETMYSGGSGDPTMDARTRIAADEVATAFGVDIDSLPNSYQSVGWDYVAAQLREHLSSRTVVSDD